MAAITPSNVTVLDAGDSASKQSKSRGIRRRVAVALTAQGGTAGDLPASAFRLKQITEVNFNGFFDGTNWRAGVQVGIANAGTDNNSVFPADLLQATDASRGNPANLTGTLYLTIEGIPL
jgi:hypothetical protein